VLTSCHFRHGLVVVLLVATHSTASPRLADAQQGGPDQTVPRKVERAARHGTIKQFANELVGAGLPVGVVIGPEDRKLQTGWQRSSEPEAESASLNNAIDVFHARHQGYAAQRGYRVMRIQPSGSSQCARAVERRLDQFSASGSAMQVVFEAIQAANRDTRPVPPPGLVGSSGAQVSVDVYRAHVNLNLSGVTLGDVLDAVITAVPGLGWAVQEHVDKEQSGKQTSPVRCQVLLFSGDSWAESGWYINPMSSQVPGKQ